jgi:hypothetical protein
LKVRGSIAVPYREVNTSPVPRHASPLSLANVLAHRATTVRRVGVGVLEGGVVGVPVVGREIQVDQDFAGMIDNSGGASAPSLVAQASRPPSTRAKPSRPAPGGRVDGERADRRFGV